MHRRALLTALATAGLGHSIQGTAVARDDPRVFQDATQLESVVDDILTPRINNRIPGAAVAIVENDETVLTKGYGDANIDTGQPVTADNTRFLIGSIAKPITFTAVMQGVEQGVLDLDADVNAYLTDSRVQVPATFETPVTLRHLGTHTAGFEWIPNPGMVTDPSRRTPLETALVDAAPDRVRPPGEVVAYSNYGATLAGHIVEEAFEVPFERYVREQIFEPLGMTHSTFQDPAPDTRPGTVASPHRLVGDQPQVADPVYVNWRPAGSMGATATDMALFMRAHLNSGTVGNSRILAADTMQQMHRQQFDRHPAVNGWRFGFYETGHPWDPGIGHSGGRLSYVAYMVLIPTASVGVFIGYNTSGVSPVTPVAELLTEYDLYTTASQPATSEYSPSPTHARQIAGEYRSTMQGAGIGEVIQRLGNVQITPDEPGGITAQTQSGTRRFVETAPYVYHERDGDGVLACTIEDGTVTKLHAASATSSFLPASTAEQQGVTGIGLGGPLAGFLTSIVGWSGYRGWQYWQAHQHSSENENNPQPQDDMPDQPAQQHPSEEDKQ